MSDKFAGGIKAGSVNISLAIILRSTTDNTALTGKVFGDVTGSYWRQGGTRTAITMATLADVDSAHADGGFKEVDAANMPGAYRFDIPDAALATGADWVVIAAKVAGAYIFLERYALEPQNSKDIFDRLGAAGAGLTAVPWNAAWDAQVQSEVADALGVYDSPTRAEATADKDELAAFIDTEVAAILVDTGTTIPGLIAALNDITAAAVLAAGDADGFTLEETLKLLLAGLSKLSGAATNTNIFRAADDSKDRITATVDSDGNRTAVTFDAAG